MERDKSSRGNASQFFVAGELCRRGYAAVVTLGNTPNTDVLCSNRQGTKFVHIQVKTFVPGTKTCSVGVKAERAYGPGFFWILAGIPLPESKAPFEYYIIPAADMARNVSSNLRAVADAELAMSTTPEAATLILRERGQDQGGEDPEQDTRMVEREAPVAGLPGAVVRSSRCGRDVLGSVAF